MVVQARLDGETEKLLMELADRMGLTPSDVVREGIRTLALVHPRARQRKIEGLGKFASGIADLGSNNKHLKGFGR